MAAEQASAFRPRCDHCREVCGVYEPLVWLLGGVARVTSRAADPELSRRGRRGSVYHRACFERRGAQTATGAPGELAV